MKAKVRGSQLFINLVNKPFDFLVMSRMNVLPKCIQLCHWLPKHIISEIIV